MMRKEINTENFTFSYGKRRISFEYGQSSLQRGIGLA